LSVSTNTTTNSTYATAKAANTAAQAANTAAQAAYTTTATKAVCSCMSSRIYLSQWKMCWVVAKTS
jgi:hypothetical protein